MGVDRQSKGGVNFKRSFSNSRLWPEVDLSQLVQLIGVIVEGIVQGFGKITGDFGLGCSSLSIGSLRSSRASAT